MTTHLPALVTVLTMVLLFATGAMVGRARGRHGIKAPATTGHPDFERVFRVQMNTLEATVLFLPCLWLAAHYWNPTWAGAIGLVWLLARAVYAWAYARGLRRGPGFIAAMIANAVLLVAAAWSICVAMSSGA